MFTTDTDFKSLANRTPFGNTTLNKLANTGCIQRLERINRQDLLRQLVRQEAIDVVSAVTERHLRQVICTETKEFSVFGNFISG